MNQENFLKFHENLCESAAAPTRWPEGVQVDDRPKLSFLFEALVQAVLDPELSPFRTSAGVRVVAEAARIAGCDTPDKIRAFGDAGRALSRKKNADYADPSRHAANKLAIFRNFLRCEELGICSVERGMVVRISDKVSRIETLLAREEGPAVVDEKLEDSCLDTLNYCCLLLALIQAREESHE